MFWFGTLLLFHYIHTVIPVREARKADLEKSYAKTGRRDAGQVFANGGIGMVLCLLNVWIPSDLWVFLFIGVMATVTADTWATELGALAGSPAFRAERQVLTAGESGGVSWVGSTAAAAGSLLIGAGGWSLAGWSGMDAELLPYVLATLAGGLVGAFADSYLGATLQVMYRAVCAANRWKCRIIVVKIPCVRAARVDVQRCSQSGQFASRRSGGLWDCRADCVIMYPSYR